MWESFREGVWHNAGFLCWEELLEEVHPQGQYQVYRHFGICVEVWRSGSHYPKRHLLEEATLMPEAERP